MRILISVVLRSWEFQITKLNWGLNFHIYWIYISLNIWISIVWKVCIQKWWIAGDIFHWTGWKWALMETIMLLMFLLCFHTFYSFAAQFGHKHISSPLPHIAHCKAFPFPKTAHGGPTTKTSGRSRPHLAAIWHPMQPNILAALHYMQYWLYIHYMQYWTPTANII